MNSQIYVPILWGLAMIIGAAVLTPVIEAIYTLFHRKEKS
jgi:hypothetical protein